MSRRDRQLNIIDDTLPQPVVSQAYPDELVIVNPPERTSGYSQVIDPHQHGVASSGTYSIRSTATPPQPSPSPAVVISSGATAVPNPGYKLLKPDYSKIYTMEDIIDLLMAIDWRLTVSNGVEVPTRYKELFDRGLLVLETPTT